MVDDVRDNEPPGGSSYVMMARTLESSFEEASPYDILRYALHEFGDDLRIACSLGVEDMVVLHEAARAARDLDVVPRVFLLDTGDSTRRPTTSSTALETGTGSPSRSTRRTRFGSRIWSAARAPTASTDPWKIAESAARSANSSRSLALCPGREPGPRACDANKGRPAPTCASSNTITTTAGS